MKINKKLFAASLIVMLMLLFAIAISVASAAPITQAEQPPPGFPGLAIVIGGISVGAAIIFPIVQLLKRLNLPDGVGGIVAVVLAAVFAALVQLSIDVPSIGEALPGIVQGLATLLDLIFQFLSLAAGSLVAFKGGRAMLPGRV